MSEIENINEKIEEHTNEALSPAANAEKPAVNEPELEGKEDIEKENQMEQTEDNKFVVDSKEVSNMESTDADVSHSCKGVLGMQSLEPASENMQDSAMEAEAADAADKYETDKLIQDIKNIQSLDSSKEEDHPVLLEESSEITSDNVNNEPELTAMDSNDTCISEKLETENYTESKENLETSKETPEIQSEESSETTSDILNNETEVIPKELVEIQAEESTESTSDKLENLKPEPEVSPKESADLEPEESMECTLDNLENEAERKESTDMETEECTESTLDRLENETKSDVIHKELDGIEAEESAESTSDKLETDPEPEVSLRKSVDMKPEEVEESTLDKLESTSDKLESTSDKLGKETENSEANSSLFKELEEMSNTDDENTQPEALPPTESIEDISSNTKETDDVSSKDCIEKQAQIPETTETSKEETKASTSQNLETELVATVDISEKETEVPATSDTKKVIQDSAKESEIIALETSDISQVQAENKDITDKEPLEPMDTCDSQESVNLVIDETSNTAENKDDPTITAKAEEDTIMEVDLDDDITKAQDNIKDISELEQEVKETTDIKDKSNDEEEKTLEDNEISKEKNSQTVETSKPKEPDFETPKDKVLTNDKDLLNKSKDDDVIPVEQPPVPIIEIDDEDDIDEIVQTKTNDTSKTIDSTMETDEKLTKTQESNKEKDVISTDTEISDKDSDATKSPDPKDSLLEIDFEKTIDESLKSYEAMKDGDDDLDDTSDEVFYSKECINYECAHKHKQFFKVPQFAFSYFKVTKKKFKTQYICADCYDKALDMYEEFCGLINAKQPLLMENIPSGRQEFVEIIDSSDDEDIADKTKPNEIAKSAFSKNDLSLIERELHNTIKSVLNRVEIQNQLTWSKTILSERLKRLQMETDYVDNELKSLQKKADKMHEGLYTCPKIKIRQLQPLDLNSGKLMAFDSHTSKEVQPIPPVGEIERPPIKLNNMYYAVKNNAIASWVPCKVIEQVEGGLNAPKNIKHYKIKFVKTLVQMAKNVPAKYLAYFDPPLVRLPIGTRVIAYFDATSLARGREKINVQSAFYPGIIAEPLKPNNKFRYLIFYDDGYTQYVYHKDVRLVCHVSECVWEDVHPASRDFIQKYLTQYSINRPMVQTQKGQSMNTESNGYWLHARVVDIDCSLVLMQFEGSKSHTEWIYRGSLRLGPVFKEYQKTLQKNSNMPVSRLPRRTEPFIRYTEDEESSSQQQQQQATDKANEANIRSVARKTFGRPDVVTSTAVPNQQQQAQNNLPAVKHLNNSTIYVEDENKPKGKVVYYTAKKNLPPRKFKPHKCGPSCLFQITHNLSAYSPLSKPLLSGWERFIIRQKIKKVVTYRSPCGKVMRHMKELHHYLRVTKNVLTVDNFDFSHETNCLAEYVIESAIVQKRDISNGQEKMAIPLVNYYDNTLPPECKYSAKVIPTEGVNINTDPSFCIGCDCDDDCANKLKCACWQLTLTGAKYGNPNAAPEEVGYQYRRLLDHVPTGIYECNSNCKCKSSCLNRVVQNNLTMKLQVFKTSNRGWGLRCINDIPRGSFVCVYAGHLLTEAKANEGGQDAGDEYFAELDYIEVAEQIKEGYESEVDLPEAEEEESYNPELDDDEFTPSRSFLTRSKQKQNANKSTRNPEEDSQERQVINFNPNADMNEDSVRENSIRKLYGKDEACYVMDAKISGNLGRYFNHSCAPNMFVQNVFVDTHDLRFPHVAFFSSSNIRAGSELTWNYNYEVGVVPGKVLYCQCGAANCRLRLL